MSVKENLEKLGITLSTPAAPLAKYVPIKQVGNLLYVSGQLPSKDGNLLYEGKVGGERTIEEGKAAARQCAINALSAINSHVDLEKIKSIVKVQIFVNCTDDFHQTPDVGNGASELFVDVLGDAGMHARDAIGVYQLPKNATVEISVIAEV